jgi:hypothetical protein
MVIILKKYSDGNRVIYATEKAYELIYQKQGFKEIEVKKSSKKAGDK